ncbi:hypothetical protein ACIO3O_13980 [Streptomyces sp. NPDC087440]|uniref:hypothetical protein n=1 Tax=Streptomyces sp. NPDC087440 TaxID=3365790 RepID=UPI00382B3A59
MRRLVLINAAGGVFVGLVAAFLPMLWMGSDGAAAVGRGVAAGGAWWLIMTFKDWWRRRKA